MKAPKPKKPPRDRVMYRETYEAFPLKPDCTPILRHTVTMHGKDVLCRCVEAHIRAAAVVDRGGKRMEYMDMRIFFEPVT